MAAPRESSAEASEWAGISESASGDDDMDFEVCFGRSNLMNDGRGVEQ